MRSMYLTSSCFLFSDCRSYMPFAAFVSSLVWLISVGLVKRIMKKKTITGLRNAAYVVSSLEKFQSSSANHRQPKLNIRENYKDLYGNTTDLCKMVEISIVLSFKSAYPTASCILCHLPAFQANSKRFRQVSVIRGTFHC